MKKKKKESQISKPYTEYKTARSPGDFRLREKGQPVCSWGNGKLVLGLHTLPSVSASPNSTSTDSTRDFHWSLSAFGGLSNPPSERFSNNHSVFLFSIVLELSPPEFWTAQQALGRTRQVPHAGRVMGWQARGAPLALVLQGLTLGTRTQTMWVT